MTTVTVSQDRDKGIVTLGGKVTSENDKSQAESLARRVGLAVTPFTEMMTLLEVLISMVCICTISV